MIRKDIIDRIRVPAGTTIQVKDYNPGWAQTEEMEELGKEELKERAQKMLAENLADLAHGGLVEHLDSAESIRETLRYQLAYAPHVVFDIPFDSPKNRRLFARDDIFRQLCTPDQWMQDVLAGLPVTEARTEQHPDDNMTDDLVVALSR